MIRIQQVHSFVCAWIFFVKYQGKVWKAWYCESDNPVRLEKDKATWMTAIIGSRITLFISWLFIVSFGSFDKKRVLRFCFDWQCWQFSGERENIASVLNCYRNDSFSRNEFSALFVLWVNHSRFRSNSLLNRSKSCIELLNVTKQIFIDRKLRKNVRREKLFCFGYYYDYY